MELNPKFQIVSKVPHKLAKVATFVVSSDGEVYSIKHYVINFVSDFLWGLPISSTNKSDCHDITELLLKVVLNTITLNQTYN
jgi:hypothetical protein